MAKIGFFMPNNVARYNTYGYDSENRLEEVRDKGTSDLIASYSYDYMGRRISSTDASSATTYYHYNGWNVVAESIGATITARYYDDNQQVMAMKKDDQTYYYQRNAHGDIVSLTDSSGSVVNSYSYDPWGNHLSSTETVANPFRYAGYRYDSDTGLYYLRARYYSAGIGRFLAIDNDKGNIKEPVTQNIYIYAGDNPINMIDPDGTLYFELWETQHYIRFDILRLKFWWYDRHFTKKRWQTYAEKGKTWLERAAGKLIMNYPEASGEYREWHSHIDTTVSWDPRTWRRTWLYEHGTYHLPFKVEAYEKFGWDL